VVFHDPPFHFHYELRQRVAQFRELVLDTRWNLRVTDSFHDAVLLHLAQCLRQHLLGNAFKLSFELSRTGFAVVERTKEQQGPFVAYKL